MDTANPYAAPGADLSEALTSREYGGLRRAPFFGWSVGLMAVYMVGLLAVEGSPGGVFALLLGLCAASIWIHVLRFRNQGSSGLWALGVVYRLRSQRALGLVQVGIFSSLFLSIGQVPLAVMEGWLHTAARFNPTTNLLRMARQGFFDSGVSWELTWPGLVAGGLMVGALAVWAVTGFRTLED